MNDTKAVADRFIDALQDAIDFAKMDQHRLSVIAAMQAYRIACDSGDIISCADRRAAKKIADKQASLLTRLLIGRR